MFPVFTHGCASLYIYKQLISSTDGVPNHVATAITSPITILTKEISRSQTPKVTATVIILFPVKGNAYTPLEAME